MNQFGGDWTQQKIDIVFKYAKAYLEIMKARPYWKTMYFDGFAGSGDIKDNSVDINSIEGAAIRILSIEDKTFDMYYFVEIDDENAKSLQKIIDSKFSHKKVHVVKEDCNVKLKALAKFLKSPKGKNFKVLAFIDPYGMQVNWETIESLKNLPVDLWILVPTGLGVNRMLKIDGNISNAWLKKLELFLGLPSSEIQNYFYKNKTEMTLFGEIATTTKEENAAAKAADLYKNRLNTLFTYVSNPYPLKNSSNSIMYHFVMASNNITAWNIANDVIKSMKN